MNGLLISENVGAGVTFIPYETEALATTRQGDSAPTASAYVGPLNVPELAWTLDPTKMNRELFEIAKEAIWDCDQTTPNEQILRRLDQRPDFFNLGTLTNHGLSFTYDASPSPSRRLPMLNARGHWLSLTLCSELLEQTAIKSIAEQRKQIVDYLGRTLFKGL